MCPRSSVALAPAVLLVCGMLSSAHGAPESDVADLLAQGRQALADGQTEQALKLANQALALAPQDPRVLAQRAGVYEARQTFDLAAADYTAMLERPDVNSSAGVAAEIHDRRGSAYFFAAEIAKSIADFDRAIELDPDREAGHWKRGISYYYAQRFDAGRKQFAAYQTVDSNDVENGVWHYLCAVRAEGQEKAAAGLLAIGRDPRVPLTEVYELFRGNARPADVLAAAQAGQPTPDELKNRLFYAHLYLGLWHEAHDRPAESLAHIQQAADKYFTGGYMGQVARVHHKLRTKPPRSSGLRHTSE